LKKEKARTVLQDLAFFDLALPVAEELDGRGNDGNHGQSLLEVGAETLRANGCHGCHASKADFAGAPCMLATGFHLAATALLRGHLFNGNGLGLHENPPE